MREAYDWYHVYSYLLLELKHVFKDLKNLYVVCFLWTLTLRECRSQSQRDFCLKPGLQAHTGLWSVSGSDGLWCVMDAHDTVMTQHKLQLSQIFALELTPGLRTHTSGVPSPLPGLWSLQDTSARFSRSCLLLLNKKELPCFCCLSPPRLAVSSSCWLSLWPADERGSEHKHVSGYMLFLEEQHVRG